MLRNDWEFKYTGAKLAEAAEEQRKFREGRLKIWEDQKKAVMDKIRSEGLDIHEDMVEKLSTQSYFSNARGGVGARIIVDPTLQQDLSECVEKVREHREKMKEYASWVEVMKAHPEQQFALNHEDWLYFFGKL